MLGAAIWTETVNQPAIGVEPVVFLPLALAVRLALSRPLQGVLIALRYRDTAQPGRRGR